MRLGRNVQEEIIVPLLWIKRDFSLSCCQTSLLQQRHENTVSYKEMCVILLNSNLPPWMQLVCWFSKGEDDFPIKQNQLAHGAQGSAEERSLGAANNRCRSIFGSGPGDLPAAGVSGLCSTPQTTRPLGGGGLAGSPAPF